MSWPVLRAEFPALNAAQLHHILTQYQASSDVGRVATWQPGKEDSLAAFKTGKAQVGGTTTVTPAKDLGRIWESLLASEWVRQSVSQSVLRGSILSLLPDQLEGGGQ